MSPHGHTETVSMVILFAFCLLNLIIVRGYPRAMIQMCRPENNGRSPFSSSTVWARDPLKAEGVAATFHSFVWLAPCSLLALNTWKIIYRVDGG